MENNEQEKEIVIDDSNIHLVRFDLRVKLTDISTAQFKDYSTKETKRRTWIGTVDGDGAGHELKHKTLTFHYCEHGKKLMEHLSRVCAHNERNSETRDIAKGECSWSNVTLKRHEPPIAVTFGDKTYKDVEYSVESYERNPVVKVTATEKKTKKVKLVTLEDLKDAIEGEKLSVAELDQIQEMIAKFKASK